MIAQRAPAFNAWLDDFFASYYRHRPVNATFIGVHDYDDRLPDYSERGVGDALADVDDLLQRLHELPAEPLTGAQELDRKLAGGFLEIQRWEYTSRHFQRGNPALYTGEAIFGTMSLFLRPFAPLSQRVAAAVARMEQVPALLAQARANVREAPAAWTQRAERECTGAMVFFGAGIDRLMHEEQIAEPALRAAADRARSACADFRTYLQTDLSHSATEAYACGPEVFDLLMRRGHFLPMDADAVREHGEAVFAASKAALERQAADFDADTPAAALAHLPDRHPATDEYYDRYAEVWNACRATAASHQLVTWPDFPIRYVPRPAWAREAAPYLYFLFYRSPAPYDQVPVVDYLVTPVEPEMSAEERERRLRANNDSVIKLNHVVHHGAIGHHVQNAYAFRAASRIGQMAAVDCASRIAMFCGGTMAEGWACYATDLMDEVGFLTPLESYSQIHSRLRMAARAIVDVKLHCGEFDFAEAAAFYQQEVGMAPEAAHNEAVKNSMFPGAAMMYLIGTDLIHELRRDLESTVGSGFDLQAFHDRFLSYGSVPVALIADAMRSEPNLSAESA